MKRSRARSRFVRGCLIASLALVVLLYGGLAGLVWWIDADVRRAAARATGEFPGDRVEALLMVVQSEDHELADRNRAVWALGQIADRRALPALETFYTGRQCDHARLLCQYELQKAIDRCRGKRQPPRWLQFLLRPVSRSS